MSVKDHLQGLLDEGLIKCEKIGSGNWYWVFGSDERVAVSVELGGLQKEKEKVMRIVEGLKFDVDDRQIGGEEEGRDEMGNRLKRLGMEVKELREEVGGWRDRDPSEVEGRKKMGEMERERAGRWTDNLEVLKGYLGKLVGGDRAVVNEVLTGVCGEEWVDGGFVEWD